MKSRTSKWIFPAALSLAALAVSPDMVHAGKGKSASSLYKAGVDAEAKDDYVLAYEDYYQAYQKEPKNLTYKTSYERLRLQAAAAAVKHGNTLRDQGDMAGALTEYMRALEIDPSYELAQQNIRAIHEKMDNPAPSGESSLGSHSGGATEMASPVELKPVANEPITLHMVEDAKVVYQTVGKAAGINVIFDPEFNSKRVTVDLQNVSLLDALHIVGLDSNTFWRPITSNTIFVAANTRAKRTELEEQAVQTFYLANAAQQTDLNDVQTAIRNLLVGAKLYAIPSQNAIVMRATPDELLLAQRIIDDLDKARPEVVVDVAVLEVNRQKERKIGVELPQSFGLTLQANSNSTSSSSSSSSNSSGTNTNTTTTNGLTLNQLGSLSATNFGVTVGQATANLLLSDTDTKVLQNPRIRATDGQKADLKVGEKIPVATGSYQTGAATAVVSSLVNTQFQYLDVGVEIEITPTVHYDHDVTLKLKIVVSQTNGSSDISGVTEPIISQRTLDQTIRLKEGEVSILSGILTTQTSNTIGGTPGLGELPILKYLFSSTDRTVSKDEIVFMLTPHVVRGTTLSPQNLAEIDTGTQQNVEVRRIATIPIKVPASMLPAIMQDKTIPATNPVPSGAQIPQGNPQPAPNTGTPQAAAPTQPDAINNSNISTDPPINLQVLGPVAMPQVGKTFQVNINLAGGKDVFEVPMKLSYDPAKMTLINADTGTFLAKDGQTTALVHRDDNGLVALSLSRPPGVAGVTGGGQLCTLTFMAKAPGDSIVNVTQATARNSKQQQLAVVTSGAIVHVSQ
jgi:general secretion pathway protein D